MAECKHWNSAVPQTVIHSFRTVVAETGANVGYVVSSGGFQSGAFTAAELTNLRLVTWPEFQAEFEKAWLEHYLLPLVDERMAVLIRYTEPLVPASFTKVDDAGVERLKALLARHDQFGWFVTRFTPIGADIYREVPSLPVRDRFPELAESVPDAVLDATGYREFAKAVIEHGESAIEEFQAVLRAGGVDVPEAQRPSGRAGQ
jgi:restriction system protein